MSVAGPRTLHHYQSVVMDSARWEHFRPRADDIVITTSYKAGTTWLQGICAALVFQAIFLNIAMKKLFKLVLIRQ